MRLLMGTPVLRRLVRTRHFLPSHCNSSVDKHTASTRDNPDHRCNCIHAFTRAALRGCNPHLSTVSKIFWYSLGSKGRTRLASSTFTSMPESCAVGLVRMSPALVQYLKNPFTRAWLLRWARGDSKGHVARHVVSCERVMSLTWIMSLASQKACSRAKVRPYL